MLNQYPVTKEKNGTIIVNSFHKFFVGISFAHFLKGPVALYCACAAV